MSYFCSCVLALSLGLFLAREATCQVTADSSPGARPTAKNDTDAHATNIENGLLPSVVIKDQPPATMKLTARMQHYHVPGVSIAFFDHGQIVWARGYGQADVLTGRPVTPETLFQAGSISKPIAAIGALKLAEQGKLKLDEDINETLKSWKLPESEFTKQQKVTLRRILSHSAGLTVHGFGGYGARDPADDSCMRSKRSQARNKSAGFQFSRFTYYAVRATIGDHVASTAATNRNARAPDLPDGSRSPRSQRASVQGSTPIRAADSF
jgi:CubicO group peptidase (beta-lactamase class C family)